ncbi:MAG: lysine transporter LysE [Anaerolineales bacterium]|nr:MAG: lysine transporter LysE [Anaerolineales bacterium]
MWIYILQGVGLGFSAAVLPGPFMAYLISQTLSRGWKRALPTALAPLISDGPIIALCLLVLSQVPTWFERTLYFAGGAFILYLAYGAFKAWRDFDLNPATYSPETGQSILKAAMMNALSPGPYIYWSLVTGPILLRGWRETPINGIGFLGGFYVTIVSSLTAIIIVFGIARQLGPRVNRALLGISAIALLCFGLVQLWLGISG